MKNLDLVKISNDAIHSIPAYRKFVRSQNLKHEIKSVQEFQQLPITEKNNYLYRYKFKEFFPKNKLPPMMYASSGSSGRPTFWMRGDRQEIIGGEIHEYIFKNIFGIRKNDKTLVVICFAMGTWVAGNYTLASCRYISNKGYNLTTATPGIDIDDILSILKNIAPDFTNLIIAGYPPFVMDIIHECQKQNIKIANKGKFIITAGDKFAEDWRDAIKSRFGLKFPHHLISIYGSADAGILGHETPLTIFLRRSSLKNKKLYRNIFGEIKAVPAIFQYHPEYIYFENVGEEIILTSPTACPLIRYNIHDIGSVYKQQEMTDLLKKSGLKKSILDSYIQKWNLPFITIKGRTDIAVTFYAINIYPEHIKAGLEDRKISKFLSGNFVAYNKTTSSGLRQKLYIKLELAPNIKASKSLRKKITSCLINGLIGVNIEFRKLYSAIHSKAIPIIILGQYQNKNLLRSAQKIIANTKGKKPRVILV